MEIYKNRWEYLKDRGVSRSGSQWELDLEIRMWNFIARIVNLIKK